MQRGQLPAAGGVLAGLQQGVNQADAPIQRLVRLRRVAQRRAVQLLCAQRLALVEVSVGQGRAGIRRPRLAGLPPVQSDGLRRQAALLQHLHAVVRGQRGERRPRGFRPRRDVLIKLQRRVGLRVPARSAVLAFLNASPTTQSRRAVEINLQGQPGIRDRRLTCLPRRPQAEQAAQITTLQLRVSGKARPRADQIVQRPGQVPALQQDVCTRSGQLQFVGRRAGRRGVQSGQRRRAVSGLGLGHRQPGAITGRRLTRQQQTVQPFGLRRVALVARNARQQRQRVRRHVGFVTRQQPQGLRAAPAPAQQGQIIVQQGRGQRSSRALPLQHRQRRRSLPCPSLDNGRRVLRLFPDRRFRARRGAGQQQTSGQAGE